MPEIISDKKVFSLLEVTASIQKTIAERYKNSFWVKAEMNKLNHYAHSGHCYPELVEKKDGKVIALMKAMLWKNDFYRIDQRFHKILKEPIKDGINILFCASISFDPMHGLSLRIIDIDPVFSLGELEREKQETIERLKREGIYDQNRKVAMAMLPQRIAVISVETSKGYSDYLKILEHNPWGYTFFNFLFPSLLQSERAIPSIINQLKRIKKVIHHFDAVAIIRGGGGDVGLSSFNNYELAREIALFPLPVITGIGHSTNETVVEMVSFKNAITPTELADYLIQMFHNFSVPVKKAEEFITERSLRILKDERLKFHNTMKYFKSVTQHQLSKNHNNIAGLTSALTQQAKFQLLQSDQNIDRNRQHILKFTPLVIQYRRQRTSEIVNRFLKQTADFIMAQQQSVQQVEKHVNFLNPENILKRGFSITLDQHGKAIKDSAKLNAGDTITTILASGKVVSKIEDVLNHRDDE
ncbi:MAG TPA: exodeoxyribonuclease VII large subunit [Ohtaekwangia sp.]|nr:exodeoxyribonuclease VII large subunit [Ohtaekwangia sp.]